MVKYVRARTNVTLIPPTRRKDFKKKEPTARAGEEAPKKPAREAHNAERAKHSYNKDFHKKRLQSPHEHEVNNAKMHEYNLKHMFPKHKKMGITTEEWLKLPEVKQQRAAASAEVQTRLAAELSSIQAAGQAGGGGGAGAQALSEDELEYESHFNEREEYTAEDRIGSANFLSRKVHLRASNIRSAKQTCSQLAATLVTRNLIPLPKDIDAFLALEDIEGRGFSEPVDRAPTEINNHQVHDSPETVLLKAGNVSTRCDGQTYDQELPLDEMPDGVVDLAAARWAAAACANDCGVVDFSEHGHVRDCTIQNRAYEALRLKMNDHLAHRGPDLADGAEQLLGPPGGHWTILLKNSLMIDVKLGRGERPEHFEEMLAPQSPLSQEEPDQGEEPEGGR
ncbi:hypothetical protein CYMTET_30293 [Cymbomonas tetramitiformis]|uniref:Uncharacterized protein n=1 Tax=Cymbomonas tetramitiformis TaxID=36881 RepID=A0AAE0FJ86_9CHLO|nr:hypothetical protein CYMTET_30293 [Cymbomonas tetramitiformis]